MRNITENACIFVLIYIAVGYSHVHFSKVLRSEIGSALITGEIKFLFLCSLYLV